MQCEFARLARYPLGDVTRMGRGRQVESYLSAEANKLGEIVPARSGGGETYVGGLVLPPVIGIHENVVCLDFSSMYPSIMIAFNISPDTVVHGNDDCYVAPEVGYKFKKEPDGFFKKILIDLINRRSSVKKKIENLPKDSDEYRALDIQQQSLKILTNSFYGYTGWSAARWYRRECAEATTAYGRHFIRRAVSVAEELGMKVIYGDTDSLFVKAQVDKDELIRKAEELASKISEELPLDLDIEEFYNAIFFTGKKKRYAGLTSSGEVVVKGLEVKRGDWCELAKEIQSEVINIILKDRDPESAAGLVSDTILMLREGKIPVEKLVVHKTLTKDISRYETKQTHVAAARRAEERGMRTYEVGEKVPYLIIKGSGSGILSDRAYPIEIVEEDGLELDIDYYINNQILPVATRILEYFGFKEAEILGSTRQKTLEQWF